MTARMVLIVWTALLMLSACSAPNSGTVAPRPGNPSGDVPATAVPAAIEMAPAFALASLDGQSVALEDLRGRWVIVNFWATWCGPCVAEMPYLQSIAAAYDEELIVLGINMREDQATAADFVDRHGLDFPILLAPDDDTLLAYGVRGLPLTVVVSPLGAVALKQVGPLNPREFDIWLTTQVAN